MQRYNILNHLECASQQSHPRERIDVSLSIGQNTTPSVSFFSRGSFRPKKYFPTARFESYLLSTLLPSLSLPLSLPFEVRARIYIALDGVTDTQRRCVSAWALRFGAGSILISIQSRTISSGSTFEENERTRVPGPTLRPSNPPASPLPSALQVGRALRFLNIPSSLGKIM